MRGGRNCATTDPVCEDGWLCVAVECRLRRVPVESSVE